MAKHNESDLQILVGSIRKLIRLAHADLYKKSEFFELGLSQSGVIRLLAEEDLLSSAELSRRLYVTPSNITGVIDRLEKKKFVKRIKKQDDRRVYLIALTEQGKKVSRSLPDPFEKKIGETLKGLSKQERLRLASALRQINFFLEEESKPGK
ncbi:MAG: MarR family transcriptional regulator [Desulfobacteraceae bacterium]